MIVPVRNSAPIVGACIRSVHDGGIDPVEVVAVDGGSVDGTEGEVVRAGARFVPGSFRRSSARRAGVSASRGRYLLFLDSDQRLRPGALAECVRTAEAGPFDAVTIEEADDAVGAWAGARSFDRRMSGAYELSYPRFFRRERYLEIGGHAAGLEDYMEDRALFLRALAGGLRVGRVGTLLVNALGEINPVEVGRRGARAAVDAREYYASAPRGEGLTTVISPRLRALTASATYRGLRAVDVATVPIYLAVVYGPRLLRAVTS